MQKNNRLQTSLLGLICGICMPFAFAPYHHIWLAILALAVLVYLIQHGHAFITAYSFGFGWFGFGAWWLAPTVHQYGGLPWMIAWLVPAFMGLVMGLFPAIWAWACIKISTYSKRPYALLLLLPASIVGIEWLRGNLFTGLPWVSLGTLALDTPAYTWLSMIGVYGTAFLPILIATSLAFLCQQKQHKLAMIGLTCSALLIAFSPSPNNANGGLFHAALIQPNIAQNHKWDEKFLQESMQRLTSLSASVANTADVIVWPESAVPFYLEKNPTWANSLYQHMQSWHTPVLFGGLKLLGKGNQAQSGLYLFDKQNEHAVQTLQFAGKKHLVPFGEYVPSWLPWLSKIVPDIGDFQAAKDGGVLVHGTNHFGSIICYESIFPEESRDRVNNGANVLVVVTNDAWYGTTPAAWQHLQASQVRAVETARYVLRAANTGISAIITPNGRITQTAPWWTPTVISGTYRTSSIITPYQAWGDKPVLLVSMLICMVMIMLGYTRKERS